MSSGLTCKVEAIEASHIYKIKGFFSESETRHNCLNSGWWCLKNLREHPADLRLYAKSKVTTWLRKAKKSVKGLV